MAAVTPPPHRVVVIGERIAGRIAEALATVGGPEAVDRLDVVDRSRPQLTMSQLGASIAREAAAAGATPGPVTLVIAAGNDWVDAEVRPEDRPALAAAVRFGGLPAARLARLDQLESQVGALLSFVADRVARARTSVVVVVPSFDLVGWEPDPRTPVPLLALDDLRAWMPLRDRAEAALADGRPAEAEALASELVFRDGATSAVSCRLIARKRLAAGDLAAARTWFEHARDAPCGTLVPVSPRCPRVAQEALRTGALALGFGVVDLRDVLADETGMLPDRRCFAGGATLSSLGAHRAAAAVADLVGVDVVRAEPPASEVAAVPAEAPVGDVGPVVAHDVRTTVPIAVARGAAVRVRLRLRVPGARPHEPVTVGVRLAGNLVTTVTASSAWSEHELVVPAGVVRAGTRPLTVEWQPADPRPAGSLEQLAVDLERGATPHPLPVFGELASLHVDTAAPH